MLSRSNLFSTRHVFSVYVQSVILLACCLLHVLAVHRANAQAISWSKDRYIANVQNQPLADLLRDFFGKQGVHAVVSRNVRGTVSGSFDNEPADFFSRIVDAYLLLWYYDGAAIYIYAPGELRSRTISLEEYRFPAISAALKKSGVWDARFPPRSDETGKVIYVSGPPRYVDLMVETIVRLEAAALAGDPGSLAKPFTLDTEHVVKVFPLRYAQAEDMLYSISGKEAMVAGTASLIRSLITESDISGLSWKLGAIRSSTRQIPSHISIPELPAVQDYFGRKHSPSSSVSKARIEADQRLNAVIIKDKPSNMPFYRMLISILDVPTRMIEINVTIVDLSTSSLRDLGVDWQWRDRTFGAGATYTARLADGATGDDISLPPPISPGFNVSTLLYDQVREFMARVRALEEKGKARILSQPTVTTFDNLEARIEQSQAAHVRVSSEHDAKLYELQTGVLLRVTPHAVLEEDGVHVSLRVEIEDGSLSTARSVDGIPIINRTSISTQAVVKENQSLLLGGLRHRESSNAVRGIPVLSSLPFIGVAFRNSISNAGERERIFMITPRIVSRVRDNGILFTLDDDMRRDLDEQFEPVIESGERTYLDRESGTESDSTESKQKKSKHATP